MANTVGIRFKKAGKIYHFDAGDLELDINDPVVVKTSRGTELGQVVVTPGQVDASEAEENLSPVLRKAEPIDLEQAEELEAKAAEALIECGKMIEELQLPMKLLTAEYNLDSSRLTFLFSAEERVDFRDLVRKLTGKFKMRVELRQVGTRDEAKLLGSFGRCGRPLCCTSFLTEFSPVSIKMAKEQDLPLNPMKISGACGRLMCCLTYEYDTYRELKKNLPKIGKQIITEKGNGKVIRHNAICNSVTVRLESGMEIETAVNQIIKD